MTAPAQLTALEVNDLYDGVVALFNGLRGSRTMVLDPAGQSTGGYWGEDATATHFISVIASTPELGIPIPLNPGDRVTAVRVSLRQAGPGILTAVLYLLDATGRTRIASTKTAIGTLQYQELALAVVGADGDVGPLPYTLPADKALLLVITAGETTADTFGGGELDFDHP